MKTTAPRLAALAACLLMATSTADAAAARKLAVDGRVSGEITGADRINLSDGSRSVGFEVDLREGQAVQIEASAVFCGRVTLFAADDDGREQLVRSIDGDCSEKNGRQLVSSAFVVPHSGRHTVAFSGRNGNDYGPFAIELASIELQADRVLVAGDNVAGLLDGDDKQLQFKVTEAGRHVLVLESSEFDPVLRIRGNGVERENDDNGEDFNSRLVAWLQPGDYELEVARVGDDGGMYRLSVERAEVVLPPGVQLQNDGDLKAGNLTGMLEGDANSYRLVVAAPSRIDFAADSEDIDPRIVVTGNGFAAQDDDSGEGTNAHLVVNLAPGTYTVAIDDVGDADAGLYTLRTAVSPAPAAATSLRVRAGAAAQGTLVAAEQQHYAFTVDRAGDYVIGMSSTELDSVLYLLRNGEVVETNDDAAEDDTNAKLEVTLEPGEYVVVAATYDGGNGPYRLEVARR